MLEKIIDSINVRHEDGTKDIIDKIIYPNALIDAKIEAMTGVHFTFCKASLRSTGEILKDYWPFPKNHDDDFVFEDDSGNKFYPVK